MASVRATQLVTEIAHAVKSAVRATQLVVEVAQKTTRPTAEVTQLVVEVAYTAATVYITPDPAVAITKALSRYYVFAEQIPTAYTSAFYDSLSMVMTVSPDPAIAITSAIDPDVYIAAYIELTWVDNAEQEDGFILQRSSDGGNTWEDIAALPADTEEYEDIGAVSTNFLYRVKATSALFGDSEWSNIAEVTT